MSDVHIIMHWSVNSFQVSMWFAPGVDELEHLGSMCDCDAWEEHRKIKPENRWCEHIAKVSDHIDEFRGSEPPAGLPDDGVTLDDIEEAAAARV